MTRSTSASLGFWRWLRSRERTFALAWLLGSALLVAALFFTPTRMMLLGGLQDLVDRRENRWSTRLAEGERLLAAGDAAGAERLLAALDLEFPARDVRHARDKEKERLLLQLARAQEQAGRGQEAVATYARLVGFDSLNYLNHFELASALVRNDGDLKRTRDAFGRALRFMPSHLPSVRALIAMAPQGDSATVIRAFERYLNAFLMQPVILRLGSDTLRVPVQADGRSQLVTLPVHCPPGCSGTIEINPLGFAIGLDSISVIPARRVGDGGASSPVHLDVAAARGTGTDTAAPGRFRANSQTSSVSVRLPAIPQGVSEIRLGIRVFKPVDEALWQSVAAHYGQASTRRAEAEARTVRYPTAEDADLVLSRMEYVREGRLLKGQERAF